MQIDDSCCVSSTDKHRNKYYSLIVFECYSLITINNYKYYRYIFNCYPSQGNFNCSYYEIRKFNCSSFYKLPQSMFRHFIAFIGRIMTDRSAQLGAIFSRTGINRTWNALNYQQRDMTSKCAHQNIKTKKIASLTCNQKPRSNSYLKLIEFDCKVRH